MLIRWSVRILSDAVDSLDNSSRNKQLLYPIDRLQHQDRVAAYNLLVKKYSELLVS